MRTMLAVVLALLIGQVAGATAVAAKDPAQSKISEFFGTYVGQSDHTIVKGVAARDASVTITENGTAGFRISWKTVIRRTARKPKVRSYEIAFVPNSKRVFLYASATKKNIVGHMGPHDPLFGDAYFWASLRGKTLTVRALFIIDDGGYEIQIFKRSLIPVGLQLLFERVRNGKTMKLITATLKKTAN